MHNNASLNSLAQGLFHKSIYSYPQLWKSKKGGNVRGHSPLKDPTWYFLLLCADSQGLYSLSVLENRNEQSCTQFSGLRSWERASAWIPFSDFLLEDNLFSYAPLPQDMECFLALSRLLFASLCFSSMFLLLKVTLYKDIQTCVFANKAPLFTRDLGPLLPSSRGLHSSGPGLQRPWQLCLQFPQIRVTLL